MPAGAAPALRFGRYEVKGELGRGGMGVVYRATDRELGRDVALKVQGAGGEVAWRRLRRIQLEAQVVAQLDHPNIVRLYDAGREGDYIYLVMQLVEGEPLAARLRGGPLDASRAVSIAADVALALAYAHQQGLVHRDVKPANVLMQGERPYLTDFGLVKAAQGDGVTLTLDTGILGTPAYMAPEQVPGSGEEVGPAADQYALGAVLFEMLTGRRPHLERSAPELLEQIRSEPIPSLVSAGLPQELDWVVQRALQRHPADRYPSCEELAADLGRWQRGEPVKARGPSVLGALRSAYRRKRRSLLVLGLSLLGLACALGLARAYTSHRAEQEAQAQEERVERRRLDMQEHYAELEAQGREAEAEAGFEGFVSNPAHQRSSARSRAWLWRAERLAERGDPAHIAAFASAYALARDEDGRGRALLGLARSARERGDFVQLEAVLRTVEARAPHLEADPEIDALKVGSLMAARRFDQVSERLGEQGTAPQAALARALAGATPTELHLDGALVTRISSPGDPAELWLVPPRGGALRRLSLTAGGVRELAPMSIQLEGAIARAYAVHLGELGAGLVTWGQGSREIVLHIRQGDGLRPAYRWEDDRPGGVQAADLDADGQVEVYVGTEAYTRHLLALTPSAGGGWTRGIAHQPSSWAGSDICGLAVADLDGDGQQELAVASAQWQSYDVRILGPSGEGGLVMRTRLKLGAVGSLLTLPGEPDRLLALKHHTYPNPQQFPEDHPYGALAGLYVLGLRGGELVVEEHVPIPLAHLTSDPLRGDLDGDGAPDLIASSDGDGGAAVWIALSLEGGGYQAAPIRGLRALAAANLDDDPADELVVADLRDRGRLWILGAGHQSLPPIAPAQPLQGALPEGSILREEWAGARDLIGLGLLDSAIEQLDLIARIAGEREESARALREAASLLLAEGRQLEAAERYGRAGRLGGRLAVESASAAAELYEGLNRPAEAEAALEALSQLPEVGDASAARWREELAGLAQARSSSWSEVFSNAPDARWRVRQPGRLRWDPGSHSIAFDIVEQPGSEAIAELPLEWGGGRLSIEADIGVERLEWSGAFFVTAHQGKLADGVGVGAQGWGGRSQLFHRRICRISDGVEDFSKAVERASTPSRSVIRVDLLEEGVVQCTLSTPDGAVLWSRRSQLAHNLEPGRLWLALSGHPGEWIGYQRARGNLYRLAVEGARVGTWDTPPRARDALGERMLVGDDEGALAAGEGQDPWGRFVALTELGRQEEAAQVLAAALRGADPSGAQLEPEVYTLLRLYPETLNPLLRKALGWRAWLNAFVVAWDTAAGLHPQDDVVRTVLALSLDLPSELKLERAQELNLARLLELRAEGALAVGRIGVARSDLDRAIEMLGATAGGSGDADEAVEEAKLLADAMELMAEVHLKLGALDAAASWTVRALHSSPTPELMADTLIASERFAPLRAHPVWRRDVWPAHLGAAVDQAGGAAPR